MQLCFIVTGAISVPPVIPSKDVFDEDEEDKYKERNPGNSLKRKESGSGGKSTLEEFIREEENKKEKINRKDYWLREGIIVKAINPLELSMDALKEIHSRFMKTFHHIHRNRFMILEVESTKFQGNVLFQEIVKDVVTKLQEYVDNINLNIYKLETRGLVSKYVFPDDDLRGRCTMVSGGGRIRPQKDPLNNPIDMVVGTPGRILQHIEEGNLVYGDIKYLVLNEADIMFDRGFGPDICKFLAPLKHRASKSDGLGHCTSATLTLHKRISSARHNFIKLSGSENKLEALLQLLVPSRAKGNKVMVFCNTLDSNRAVNHYLVENMIHTINYHGENDIDDRPTLVCTDLATRGLDLDVDHVVMFDFPLNSIDYLHRTGRTARMGAKGKVTSLVTKKDLILATRIEEAMRKNESLEAIMKEGVRRDIARTQVNGQSGKDRKLVKVSKVKNNPGGRASLGNK
ncbi:hypothetical protein Ahy_A04g019743 [Arachis hypogaea]|uniref:Helicase C-terminal domain-containing protein n=2 Tax=Arachis hypogaea TaxID=3818 RepID=A0A445DGL5_ARAHY|nr:hypothetical protein Ahy_A04g019743 [Arachis hypogaea]